MQLTILTLLYLTFLGLYWFKNRRKISQLDLVDCTFFFLLFNIINLNNQSFIYIFIIIILIISFKLAIPYLGVIIVYLNNIFNRTPSQVVSSKSLSLKEMIIKQRDFNILLNKLNEKDLNGVKNIRTGTTNDLLIATAKRGNNVPVPIILDGMVQYSILNVLNKTEQWVYDMLSKEKVFLGNVFYAFYKEGRLYIIKNK